MSAFSQLPLQQAIYQALIADSALMATITGVFDRVPEHTAFPYVTIGDGAVSDWSTKTTNGTQETLIFHIWSREGGRSETGAIMQQIYSLLHKGTLAVTGQSLVSLDFLSSSIGMETDGWTYHGIMKFRALLEATS